MSRTIFSSSIYQSLNTNTTQIRLIDILPTLDEGGRVQCKILHASLDSRAVGYTALSYVWGDPSITKEIIIEDAIFNATANLASALQFMQASLPRLPDGSCLVWADAICINQTDDLEKTSQVRMMDRIYKEAKEVIAWLGPSSDEVGLGLQLLNDIGGNMRTVEVSELMRRYPQYWEAADPSPPAYNKYWNSLDRFLDLPYWKRSWTIQEMVLPRTLWFQFGDKTLGWETLKGMVALQMAVSRGMVKIPNPRSNLAVHLEMGSQAYLPLRLVNHCKVLQQQPLDDSQQNLVLFSETTGQLATDPRDKLFAFYALNISPIEPDYTKDVRQAYGAAAASWMRSGGLDPCLKFSGLCYGDHSNLKLPSWIPNWDALAQPDVAVARQLNDNFGNYEANKGLPEGVTGVDDEFTLHEVGVMHGTVDWIGGDPTEAQQQGVNGFQNYLVSIMESFTGAIDQAKSAIPPLQLILRTITLDRVESTNQIIAGTEKLYKDYGRVDQLCRAFLNVLSRTPGKSPTLETMTRSLKLCQRWGYDPQQETLVNFCRRQIFWGHEVPEAITNRQFLDPHYMEVDSSAQMSIYINASRGLFCGRVFRTSDGSVGLGPLNMLPGDQLYVLSGCSFPVLLRRMPSEAEGAYSYVGPCFVHGLMYGEVGEAVAAEVAELDVLEIR
ncbi:unnamed protein product [Clonostachys rhizophaga]|uniref:Heterokaryon incompatibility domain-containing protein n=1 Tax=Clonostachys rhizophaga TaxID=160324 RepID=A0A9N9V1H6_9HYPO|nr:unnamed protein product [Clonostachys rhizophaga]